MSKTVIFNIDDTVMVEYITIFPSPSMFKFKLCEGTECGLHLLSYKIEENESDDARRLIS